MVASRGQAICCGRRRCRSPWTPERLGSRSEPRSSIPPERGNIAGLWPLINTDGLSRLTPLVRWRPPSPLFSYSRGGCARDAVKRLAGSITRRFTVLLPQFPASIRCLYPAMLLMAVFVAVVVGAAVRARQSGAMDLGTHLCAAAMRSSPQRPAFRLSSWIRLGAGTACGSFRRPGSVDGEPRRTLDPGRRLQQQHSGSFRRSSSI